MAIAVVRADADERHLRLQARQNRRVHRDGTSVMTDLEHVDSWQHPPRLDSGQNAYLGISRQQDRRSAVPYDHDDRRLVRGCIRHRRGG